jgi:hypothetical protein
VVISSNTTTFNESINSQVTRPIILDSASNSIEIDHRYSDPSIPQILEDLNHIHEDDEEARYASLS